MHGYGCRVHEFGEVDVGLVRGVGHVVECHCWDGGGGCGGGEWDGWVGCESTFRLWAHHLFFSCAVEGVAEFGAADVADEDIGGQIFDDGKALEFGLLEDFLYLFNPHSSGR